MRLLSLTTNDEFNLTTFTDDENLPPYAILSHTWIEGEEVIYDELIAGTGKEKAGYTKLRFCGRRAAQDDLQYFWVDTCCIDKTMNHELNTAINSMFRWYQRAARCYVFLSDVVLPHNAPDLQLYHITWKDAFRRSRWFTRGWTLQELIAPPTVEFFSKEGKALGSRVSLEQDIHEVTGIPVQALRGSRLSGFSVNNRMSWAAKRKTTITEDSAYCLLGIFGVFIPLIYGEGEEHALLRLREVVQKRQETRGEATLGNLPDQALEEDEEEHDRGGRRDGEETHPNSNSLDLTQTSIYGRCRSLSSSNPVLDIPTKEIELILGRIPQSQHIEIAEIITSNCKMAAFEFYHENALWRNKFSSLDQPRDPKLFQLSNGDFPQKPDDLDLRLWIRKIQHVSATQKKTDLNPLSLGVIRDYSSRNEYHFKEALNILKMLYPWGLLNALEFESSLCYAISWCRHLYASDCEARLELLWVELHPSKIDENWKPTLDRAKIPD